ncbi:glycosyltransferase family 2 protein [Paenibacillus glufosinatiresistens]|uniref:glycosyltransferase family 2 protein n=1 Tax=Paenibacillus glufosinatiresistens TaxID=3070657 RepID=UPI00286E8ACD|nr:glycosyltransferase family 2 protein [Paenibacillus sp. YX.27]
MPTISLCMIVRDEEKALARCLSSVLGVADEMIVVDTGSEDRTKEVAARFGARVCTFEWRDDFAAARNYAFSLASCEYLFWLDADDILKERDRERMMELKAALPPGCRRVTMPYHLAFDSSGNVVYSLRRNRLVRRECGFQWIGAVHEYLAADGPGLDSEVCVTHLKEKGHSDRNLRIYRERAERGEAFTPRDVYYYANELRDHGQWREAAGQYERFLDGGQGWVEDNIQAGLKLAECRMKLDDRPGGFRALCGTLLHDVPRPENCCALGHFFWEEQRFGQAIYWYEQALTARRPENGMGIQNAAASTWLPHLQLCLCHHRLGDLRRAHWHNEQALAYAPSHPSLLHNRRYFREKLGPDGDCPGEKSGGAGKI